MTKDTEWKATFEDAEQASLEGALLATPAARLEWLEEAVRFAYRTGALPRRERSVQAEDADPAVRPD